MRFDLLTIFPDLFESPLKEGILRRAQESGRIAVGIHNIRDFAEDRHAMTDDRPFGGGEGMVMKPEPITACLSRVRTEHGQGRVVLLSPQGRRFDQRLAEELAGHDHLIFLCGRYEGVDERVRELVVDEEISIGDFILTGGELAAMVVIDAVTRLLPGVLGCSDSADQDTFSRGLLKHGQYTRPREFEGLEVPEVLLSGDHAAVARWRLIDSVERTLARRPELFSGQRFSKDEVKTLRQAGLWERVKELTKA